MMNNSEIIESVLLKLDDFTTDETDDYANKIVSSEEIISLYTTAENLALSYLRATELPDDPRVDDGLCIWTAGLLYKKYDERPNDLTDETNTIGVGDQLIITAREMLKPLRYYEFIMG